MLGRDRIEVGDPLPVEQGRIAVRVGRARGVLCLLLQPAHAWVSARLLISLRIKDSHAEICSSATYSLGLCACSISPGPHTMLGTPAAWNNPASVPYATLRRVWS